MIKGFTRYDNLFSLFSLCGLNCGLCTMQIRGECPGCFAESHCAQTCAFAPCSVRHGNVQYCFECEESPCEKYDGCDQYDSLISHKNQKSDMEKAKRIGIENYRAQIVKKKELLDRLLSEYDDGRKDVFFCLAVNLMEPDDLSAILEEADSSAKGMPLSEKAAYIKHNMIKTAEKKGILLRLRR